MTAAAPDRPDAERLARSGESMLARALRRARLSIFWERLWPALATIVTAIGLFLALSWLGLWLWLPPLGRAIGLVAFGVLAVAALAPLFFVRLPSAVDGLRRLDRTSLMPHRPATAVADQMAPEVGDQFATALWRAHVERALRAARALKAGRPSPRLAWRDPYAVRALVLLLAVATFVAAGSERTRRVAAAFDWSGVVTPRELPDRRLGDAADLYRPAAADSARPAARRADADARADHRDGAGRLDTGGARDRHSPGSTSRRPAASPKPPAEAKPQAPERHRGAPLHHHRRRHRDGARRRATS